MSDAAKRRDHIVDALEAVARVPQDMYRREKVGKVVHAGMRDRILG